GSTRLRAPRGVTAASACAAIDISGARLGPAVQSAFDLAAPGPTTGAGVFALADRTRARPAADRHVALAAQRVLGQVMVADVGGNVVVGPRRDRVDLDDAAADVEPDDRCLRTRRRFRTSQAGHPCLLAVEGTCEWLDFAQCAA